MTATAAEPSVALVLVVNVQTLRENNFSIEMLHRESLVVTDYGHPMKA